MQNNGIIDLVQLGDYDSVISSLSNDNNKDLIHKVDATGCSLLHWASINNRYKIVKYLILCGIDVNTVGGTLKEIPLQWTVRNNNFNKLIHLLIIKGSNLNHKNMYGHTALHIASKHGNLHAMYQLLYHGADIDATDNYGNTPLYDILSDGNNMPIEFKRQVVRLLLNYGTNIMHKNNDGNTGIHIMANSKLSFDPYITLLLMDTCGYSLDKSISTALQIKNNQGFTPFQVAKINRHLDMIHFLYDAYMYRMFPKTLPVLFSTTAVCFSFYILHHYNVFYAISINILIFFITSKLTQEMIITARSRVSMGWAYGIITSLSGCYYYYLSSYWSIYWYIFYYGVVILIYYTLYRTANTIPTCLIPQINRSLLYNRLLKSGLKEGLTPITEEGKDQLHENTRSHLNDFSKEDYLSADSDDDDDDDDDDEEREKVLKGQDEWLHEEYIDDKSSTIIDMKAYNRSRHSQQKVFKLCSTCLCDKSEASTHCVKCDKCIIDLDHHCDFLNNCIGQNNRRLFVFFTFLASLGCGLHAYTSMYTEWYIFKNQVFHTTSKASFLLSMYTAATLSILIGFITINQLLSIADETTTFEVLRKHHLMKLRCNLLGWRNIKDFLLTGKYKVRPIETSHSSTTTTTTSNTTNKHFNIDMMMIHTNNGMDLLDGLEKCSDKKSDDSDNTTTTTIRNHSHSIDNSVSKSNKGHTRKSMWLNLFGLTRSSHTQTSTSTSTSPSYKETYIACKSPRYSSTSEDEIHVRSPMIRRHINNINPNRSNSVDNSDDYQVYTRENDTKEYPPYYTKQSINQSNILTYSTTNTTSRRMMNHNNNNNNTISMTSSSSSSVPSTINKTIYSLPNTVLHL